MLEQNLGQFFLRVFQGALLESRSSTPPVPNTISAWVDSRVQGHSGQIRFLVREPVTMQAVATMIEEYYCEKEGCASIHVTDTTLDGHFWPGDIEVVFAITGTLQPNQKNGTVVTIDTKPVQ